MSEHRQRRRAIIPGPGIARPARAPKPDPEPDEYAAPAHFSAVNSIAEVVSRVPTPSMESVIAVKSPSATLIAVGNAARQPWPSA
jgi:hypothetical protein